MQVQLRWASQGDPQTMDPHSQNELLTNSMNGQVYEALVTRDKQLNVAPSLATEWQQVTPTRWRFKLRPNVTFHDGTPLTVRSVSTRSLCSMLESVFLKSKRVAISRWA